MTPIPSKPKQGAGEKGLLGRLILIFWSGAGGIKLLNRLILFLGIYMALSVIAVVTAVVGGGRQGVEARNRQKIVQEIFKTVCTSLPEIDSSSAPIPAERVAAALRGAINEDMAGDFWICQPTDDDFNTMAVYSGPLTEPFVTLLTREGATTSWSTADWHRSRTYKTAVNLKQLPIDQ